jgi:hypothetical protein
MKSKKKPLRLRFWGGILACTLLLTIAGQAQSQQVFLFVPYHSQVPPNDPDPAYANWFWPEPGNANTPNGFCTCACVEMLFDYWESCWHNNPPLPQREIAAVANTNDVMNTGTAHVGTYLDDARRAVHFSTKTAPWPSAPPNYIGGVNGPTGYSWRAPDSSGAVRGFVGIDGSWTGNGWTMAQLKQTIALGYPIMVNVDGAALANHAEHDTNDSDWPYNVDIEPENTVVGHSIVLRGFRDNIINPNLSVFFYCDPARGAAWICQQQTFWDSVWTSKEFLFVAPWQTTISIPPLGSFMPNGFAITGTSRYDDVLPALGTGISIQAGQAKGTLTFHKKTAANKLAAALAQGQAGTILFNPNAAMTSGTLLQKNWQCVTTAYDTSIASVATYGTVSTTSTSFPGGGYTDEIGGVASDTLIVPKPVAHWDASICRIPRDAIWWRGEHIPVTPDDYAPGNPNTFRAEVVNRGDISATNVLVKFHYGDPALAEFYPDAAITQFASTVLPFIAPGDTVLSDGVTFTPPTGNSFGENYYGFFVALESSGDPPHDIWVELDNNFACRSVHRTEVAGPGSADMQFFAVNPFPDSCWIVTRLEASMPGDWLAELGPAGTDSAYMTPGERQSRILMVDVGQQALATFNVYEDVYDTDGNFLRRTGGLIYEVLYNSVPTFLSSYFAEFKESAITIVWRLSEADGAMKFSILKRVHPDGDFQEIHNPLIERAELLFTFTDKNYEPGKAYSYRVVVSDAGGQRVLFETEAISTFAISLSLDQNYPNPFNPITTISFSVPDKTQVYLSIHDLEGKLVKTLFNDTLDQGYKQTSWDGTDSQGNPVSSGVYFYRLKTGGKLLTRKMVVVR